MLDTHYSLQSEVTAAGHLYPPALFCQTAKLMKIDTFPTAWTPYCQKNTTSMQTMGHLGQLHGPSMFALRQKFMECSINNPALSLLMKHLVIGQRQKPPNFSAFHWSPHGSLVSIGQNFVTRVVHLPKRTETSLITESDQSGPNHQLLQLCTAWTAWSDSDQAMRAVHSCISWL